MEGKDEKYVKLIQTAFNLIGSLGYENVTITQLSKQSGISRGWIYKYVDSDIEGVLKFCLKEYGQEFARFSDIKSYTSPEDFNGSILTFSSALADHIKDEPEPILIYFSNYNSDNLVGDLIRELDNKYLLIMAQNIQNSYGLQPEEASDKARLIHLMRMGGLHSFAGFEGEDEEYQRKKSQFITLLGTLLDQLGNG